MPHKCVEDRAKSREMTKSYLQQARAPTFRSRALNSRKLPRLRPHVSRPQNSLAKTLRMSASITDDLKQELEHSGGLDKDTVRAFLTKRGILQEQSVCKEPECEICAIQAGHNLCLASAACKHAAKGNPVGCSWVF